MPERGNEQSFAFGDEEWFTKDEKEFEVSEEKSKKKKNYYCDKVKKLKELLKEKENDTMMALSNELKKRLVKWMYREKDWGERESRICKWPFRKC